ncbi:MAG: ABC transporter substrate-binding protein [Gammaproteobacteria bacterium WSBS_2016_MAG_OTU1]
MAKKHELKHVKQQGEVNSNLPEVVDQFQRREISRRDFMQIASALGMSAAAVYGFAGGAPKAYAQTPKRGGTFRMDMALQELKDPQSFSWIEGSNVSRDIVEYLTSYGEDGVVKPYLAERWTVSSDGKTVDLFLRKGIKWSNGDDFGSEDVMHNFNRWRIEGNTSANHGEWNKASGLADVEQVNSHQVRLHLSAADLSIAHRLYAYPTQIVHRSFDDTGANLTENAIGTGAFQLEFYGVGEGAKIVRRPGYWGGPEGQGDSYLDAVHFVDLGEDEQAPVSALASGQIDWMYKILPKQLEIIKTLPDLNILKAVTQQTPVIRFNVTKVDQKVREAIQLATDNDEMLRIAFGGAGAAAENHHTSPTQPDYYDLGFRPKQNLDKARSLIQEAGMEGKPIKLTLGNTQGSWEQDTCQVLQEQCKKAGINIQLEVLPQAQYWEVWDKSDFGLTFWTSRPLAVMVHKLAYKSGVPWNESHFSSQKYDDALAAAAASPDAGVARQYMKVCQEELLANNVMVQPFFTALYTGGKNKVKNFQKHPAEFYHMRRLWIEG